jgi:uncharacterized protein YndB with AHSA1/START domain
MNPKSESPAAGMEIVSTRVFDAPRAKVFEAFANPHHLPHWWGPMGFTNTFKEFDFRPGGAWRFVMHGPDGKTYDIAKDFVEVQAPEKIVLDQLGPMHRFRMTMIYEDLGTLTRITWRMVFEPHVDNAKFHDFIVAANEQNFDRLAAYLAKARI